ncbi:MAG TPA: Ig-like domain-containing protein, partial [Solirubrobacteraceae bacterium]|nr:Ig-like domain-containing protein [Solirubrobacteraceae bacterium]
MSEDTEEHLFFGAFVLYMVDGPLAGRTFEGSDYNLGEDYLSLTNGPATESDGAISHPRSYAVRNGEQQILRVDELIRMRRGEQDVRITYVVTNVSNGPIAFRPASTGVVGGTAALTSSPGRGLTIMDGRNGDGARLEDVRTSSLPGDLAPVPVPAWNSYRADMYHDTFGLLRTAGGLGAPKIVPDWGGVAVEWTDHAAAPLAAGATARYEILWRFDLVPPLYVTSPRRDGYVGATGTITARLGDALGAPDAGAPVRWSVSGANTRAEAGAVTGADGTATLTYTSANAGWDTVTVYRDLDGDGTWDASEPRQTVDMYWSPPLPPLRVSTPGYAPQAGEQAFVDVNVRDELSEPRQGAAVRWSVSGVTELAETTARTSSYGQTTLRYTAPRSGTDMLRVYVDLDDDGVRDAGEPLEIATVQWRQAPPPPPTLTTLDGDAMDVTVSSRGNVDATYHDAAGVLRRLADCTACGGLVAYFADGPLAGRSFDSSAFFGEPQGAVTRSGDTLTQVSTYRIRRDDVDYVRVHQTTTYTEGDLRLRTSYRLENLTGEPLRLRAGVATPLRVGGSYYGPSVQLAGPPRFVGGEQPATGIGAGLEEVQGSAWDRWGAGYAGSLHNALGSAHGLDGRLPANDDNYGAAVQWGATSLAPGGGPTYDLAWRVEKPPALHVTPVSHVAETRHPHRVVATLVDDREQPRNGDALRWSVTGVNPTASEQTTVTTGLGQAVITWTGTTVGRDTLTVWEDVDGNGTRDAGEPQRVVTVDWRQESAVDPPVFDPLVAPDGTTVRVALLGSGDQRFFGLTPSEAGRFPTCADGSPLVNLRVRVNVDPAEGSVVAGSMSLRTVSPEQPDLEHPIDSIPPAGEAVENTYAFVVECLRDAALYICYTLEEAGLPAERFCVLLGGLGLWDPSGVVYDQDRYQAELAKGRSADAARAAAAISGARVRLERRYDGAYRQVLSGDPFVTPNVNPYVTGTDGRFGWAVSAGTYRVVVTAPGYETATSRAVTVPPPNLQVHVGLTPIAGAEPDPEPTPAPTATPTPTATPPAAPTATVAPAATDAATPTAVPLPAAP